MIGLNEYTGKQKESWRGWMWNRIIERLPDYKPGMKNGSLQRICRDKVAIYLPGPDDIDRRIAMTKGFRNENLIAVDICEDRIKAVRKAGGVGICGGLQNVLAEWKAKDHLDVVFADLCGGLNESEKKLWLLASTALNGWGVFAVNLLRGRDKGSNALRSGIKESCSRGYVGDYLLGIDPTKHRGFQAFAEIVMRLVPLHDGETVASVRNRRAYFIENINPIFNSYSSSGANQIFDSVVMKLWGCAGHEDSRTVDAITSERTHLIPKKMRTSHSIRPKMAALRAVRTMKGSNT